MRESNCFILLSCVSALRVTGQSDVIGSHEPVHVTVGHDVILPCHLEPQYDVTTLTVEWRRDESFVHIYRNKKNDPGLQDENFRGRTSLFLDELVKGNISLKLTNVTEQDEGKYSCFVPKLDSQVRRGFINLRVDSKFVKTSTTETPLHPNTLQTPDAKNEPSGARSHLPVVIPATVFFVLVILGVVAGFLYKHMCPKENLLKNDAATNTTSQV